MRSGHEFVDSEEEKEEGEQGRWDGEGGRRDTEKKTEEAWIPKVATKQFKLRVASRTLSIIKSNGSKFST